MKKRKIPAFQSEAEEASWWYSNKKKLDRDLQDAAQSGALRKLSPAVILKRASASGSYRFACPRPT
jgi:hypothetical protein